MGQKVNPYGFRLGIIRDTRSKWFAEGREYRDQLVEDLQARKTIHERHHHAGISNILIERAAGTTTVTIESAKPGIIIGRGGSDVDRLRRDLDSFMSGRVRVNVEETKNPQQNAQLIAEEIAGQIERRASIRRAMSQAMDRAMRVGVDGIRVAVSGRLMGAEIARTERMGPEGSVPLHTLRADVEKGFSEAVTGYGHIGVQVYVCNGEILPPPPSPPEGQQEEASDEPDAIDAVDAEDVVTGEVEQAEEGEEPAHQPAEERPVEDAAEEQAEETEGGADTAEMDELLAESDSDEAATVSASTKQAEAPVETEAATEPPEAAPADETPAEETETSAEEDTGDVDA
jgi:small subunit ribosomal protein S3